MSKQVTPRHITSSHAMSRHLPSRSQQVKLEQNIKLYRLTGYEIHIISPWSSFAIPTSIGTSVPPVGHVSSWSCSTPTLMLDCKSSVTTPRRYCKALKDGVDSSSVEAPDKHVFAIHLWNGSTTSISETSSRLDWKKKIGCQLI